MLLPKGTHRSSWAGRMYPDERMLRDKMLGSIRDSSVSGVFRMRPTGEVMAGDFPEAAGPAQHLCPSGSCQTRRPVGTGAPRGHQSIRQNVTLQADRSRVQGLQPAQCHGSVPSHLSSCSLSSECLRFSAISVSLSPPLSIPVSLSTNRFQSLGPECTGPPACWKRKS